jgi:SNF2 family DNA or RNA helicase
MNTENITYLLYDKAFNQDHSYNNINGISVTIEQLFESKYPYYEGQEAINEFNKIFNENNYMLIPQNLDLNFYNIYLFYYNSSNIAVKITIICIDNIKLEHYITEKKQLPNLEFLMDTCRNHQLYLNINKGKLLVDIKTNNANINKNTETIIALSGLPNADITDLMIEQPDFVNINMYPYQKRTVKWMLDRELEHDSIQYTIHNEILFGNISYDLIKHEFQIINNREKLTFNGGALIDEVGLGKTYQMIVLSLLNPPTCISYIQPQYNKLFSKATLIICPNQLSVQWSREIIKMIKETYNKKIVLLVTKPQHDKCTYQDLLDADFVIISFNFLANQSFLSQWINQISTLKTYYKHSTYSHEKALELINKLSAELKLNPKNISNKNPNPLLIFWHRLIVDEFHEIFSNKSYNYIENFLKLFNSNNKWSATGTPFDKSNSCLMNMVDYITSYKNVKGNTILLNKHIMNYLSTKLFRKNTKKSIMSEYQLLPLNESVVWLDFSKTEWLMYNAYLANENIDRFNETLRKICCHPKLAEEIKNVLSNCKTLEDIEKMMVSHYEKQANSASNKVNYMEYKIKKAYVKIKILYWKQQRKFLKQLDYKVEIECPNIQNDINISKNELVKDLDEEELNEDIVDLNVYFQNAFLEEENQEDKDNLQNNKKVIIISDASQTKIIDLIKKKLDNEKLMSIQDLEDSIVNYNNKLLILKKDYTGKKATFDYFNDVMKKIKLTTEKSIVKSNTDCEAESEADSDSESESEESECSICLSQIKGSDIGVTKCGHIYCYLCVKPFIEKNNRCPMCNKHINLQEIYMIQQPKKELVLSQEFLDKQLLINHVGTKLANLIFFIKKTNKHIIIFSQWNDLLKNVGDVLNDYGIKNVFCKGHVWQRDKAIREFNNNDDIKVIMLSSESAASGTNLTKAEMVILLDPVYGSYEYRRNTEWQAIGRAYRMGQTKQVEVVRFIIKNTIEQEIYDMNKKADQKNKDDILLMFNDITETDGNTLNLEKVEIEKITDSYNKSNKKGDKLLVKKHKIKKIKADKEDEDIEDEEDTDDD